MCVCSKKRLSSFLHKVRVCALNVETRGADRLLFNRLQRNIAIHRSCPHQTLTHVHSVVLPSPLFCGVGLQCVCRVPSRVCECVPVGC